MSIDAGHDHVSGPGQAPCAGACARCGKGALAIVHQPFFGNPDANYLVEKLNVLELHDRIADQEARIVKARDRANTYRSAIGNSAAVGGDTARRYFDSVLDALADTDTDTHLRKVA